MEDSHLSRISGWASKESSPLCLHFHCTKFAVEVKLMFHVMCRGKVGHADVNY